MKTLHYGTSHGKSRVSQWNVILCNRSDMERGDTSWAQADEPWKRLQWARGQTEFATPTAFARACRVDVQQYLAMEAEPGRSRVRKLDPETAQKVARKTGLRWEWILTGDGQPWMLDTAASDRVRAALKGVLPDDEVEQIASLTELLDRKRSGTGG